MHNNIHTHTRWQTHLLATSEGCCSLLVAQQQQQQQHRSICHDKYLSSSAGASPARRIFYERIHNFSACILMHSKCRHSNMYIKVHVGTSKLLHHWGSSMITNKYKNILGTNCIWRQQNYSFRHFIVILDHHQKAKQSCRSFTYLKSQKTRESSHSWWLKLLQDLPRAL